MDILKKLISSIAPTISTILGGPLAGIATQFLADKLVGNPDASISDIITAVKSPDAAIKLKELDIQFKLELAKLQLEHEKLDSQDRQAQLEINLEDAKSGNFFKGGWRPALGWLGVIAIFNNFVVLPYLAMFNISIPVLDVGELMPLVILLLGGIGARSYEKIKGIK